MTVRADGRLSDAPMTSITCQPCGAEVLVRKSSWDQTSVQWNAQSLSQCRERAEMLAQAKMETGLGGIRPGLLLVCAGLRASIESAAGTGALPVFDEN